MSQRPLVLPALALALLTGCGGSSPEPAPAPSLAAVQARPPAPAGSGALAAIADSPQARARTGFVDLSRLDEVRRAITPSRVLAAVLEGGAEDARRVPEGAAVTAVRVGQATVLRGKGLPTGLGSASGSEGVVLGGSADLVRLLQQPRPQESIGGVRGPSVVQSCLGGTIAQTVFQPTGFNRNLEAVGVGLRTSLDAPKGLQLVLCYAPRLLRQVDAATRSFERTFGSLRSGRQKAKVVEEEYGEDTAVYAVVPAEAVSGAGIARLLAGGGVLALLQR